MVVTSATRWFYLRGRADTSDGSVPEAIDEQAGVV